jgi:hypothetical protein
MVGLLAHGSGIVFVVTWIPFGPIGAIAVDIFYCLWWRVVILCR